MRCKYEELMLYWSGELPQKRHGEVEQHLKTCEQCRKMLADLEVLDQEVKTLPLLKPGKDLVQAALEKHTTSEKRFWFLPVPAFQVITAMIVVFVLSLGYVLMNIPEQPLPPQEKTSALDPPYVDSNLPRQIARIHKKVNRLEERIRRSERKEIRFARTTRIQRKVAAVRSELYNLKTSIVESEQFPFRNTFTRQRRKTYENRTFHRRKHNNDHLLSFSGANVC